MGHSTTGKHFWGSMATWLTITIAIATKPAAGQIFPVQANINVTPPYTVYLSHYTSPTQQRVMVNLLLHDPVVTSVDVRFRFTLEGGGIRLYTNPGWIPQPFSLTNGISTLIPAETIAEYFQPQHIVVEGMNPQDFFRSGKLPEGFYQFKVEVLEYHRGVTISNPARTGIWLLLNEAPRMVFPTPNQKVIATNPQMLNFSWVPSGISSPLSAQTTMYEFTMVELMDNTDPTIAITTASDAIRFTRTLQQTSLFYGPGEPQLMPGKRYAVRVRAYNTEGYELFKNNGYSEVRVFQFGDVCNPPISFSLKDETQSTFGIDVQADPGNTAWQAQFRESGDESGTWSELKAEPGTNAKTVKGLKASTTYQVQVRGICGPFTSDFTLPQTITTKEKVNSQRDCENTISPIVVAKAAPLQQLKPDDILLAALVPIRVTEVTRQGGGKFSGKGIATLPLFNAGLAVTFDGIEINELMQLTSGEVIAVRDEVKAALFDDITGVGGGAGGGGGTDTTGTGTWPEFTDTITTEVPFDSVLVVNDSTVWVIPTGGGEAIVVDLGGDDCLLIVPPDGNMDNAVVVYNGAAKPYSAGSGTGTDAGQEQFTGFLAKFTPARGQQYGFDSLRYQANADNYQVLADYYEEMEVNGKLIKLPWKALAVGQVDPVTLQVRRSSESIPYSDLKVSVLDGVELQPTAGANTASQTYNLTGTTDGNEFAVVATFRSGDKELYAGGIWAATYQQKNFNLYIVPLPGVKVDTAIGWVQNGINIIYSQAVVRWNVQPLYGFPGVELGDNGLDWADKQMLSAYNEEMNSVIKEFKHWKSNADKDAYYLFVVPSFSENSVEGYMPLGYNYGFVTKAQLDARTVAHELGHGAFALRHTFSEKNVVYLPKGTTDNLMDYTNGNSLLKYQWDLVHDPERPLFAWTEEMEEGAMITSPFEIQLFDGTTKKGQDSTLLITTTPAMPDIRVKIVSATNKGKYKVKLEIKYLRQCTGSGAGRTPNQQISFPANGWKEINEGIEWDIDFGTDATTQRPMIRGGIAYLIAESSTNQKDTLRFFIKGTNPTVQQVNEFLNQPPYNNVWFFKKIIFHESGSPNNLSAEAKQFNPYNQKQENLTESNWNAFSRLPNFGEPCGWGLSQLDNPAPPAQALWDWQANIRSAYDLLIEKQNAVTTHLNDCNLIVIGWNAPSRPIVTKPDTIEGGITYTHASSPSFTHAINAHLGNAPTGNTRSFIDACWMKLYNGMGDYHYYYLVYDGNKKAPPTWHICNFSTWRDKKGGKHYNYYVRDIGNQATP